MKDTEWTKVLGWPGYRVYRHEINESAKTLKLWVRRKRGNRKLVCSGCGGKLSQVYDTYEREVRDLPWSEFRTTVVVELYRVRRSASASRKRLGWPARARRCGEWPSSSGYRRARCVPSISVICNAGRPVAGSRPCGRWESTRSIWGRSRSF